MQQREWRRAEVTSQETPTNVTHPPLLWKFGRQVADLKSLLFPTHPSPVVTLWWPSKCRSSCSTYCIMRLPTFLSDSSEAEQHLEAAGKQQELRSSCRTALLWVLKPRKFQGKWKSANHYIFAFFQRWRWYLLHSRPALPLQSSLAICHRHRQSQGAYTMTVFTWFWG